MAQYRPGSAEQQKYGSLMFLLLFLPLSFYCGDLQRSQHSPMMLLITV